MDSTRTLTRAELSDRVPASARDVAAAANALAREQATFERETHWCPSGLAEADCVPFRAAQAKAYLPALQDAEREAEAAADRIAAVVTPVLTQTHDLERPLSPAQMATAGTLLPMLQHEADMLPLPELARRVQGAVRNDDVAKLHVYVEVLPVRIQAGAGQPAPDGAPVLTADGAPKTAWPAGSPADEEAANELRRLVGEIRSARRDDSFDDLRADAVAVLEQVDALRRAARQRAQDEAPRLTWDGKPKTAWPARA